MDDERRQHQQRLRDTLRRSLDELEIQRAQYGLDVPIAIVSSIAQKEQELLAVEAALSSPISSEVAHALGPDGQYQAMTQELRRFVKLFHDAATWQDNERLMGQRQRQRYEIVALALIVGVLLSICVLLIYIVVRLPV